MLFKLLDDDLLYHVGIVVVFRARLEVIPPDVTEHGVEDPVNIVVFREELGAVVLKLLEEDQLCHAGVVKVLRVRLGVGPRDFLGHDVGDLIGDGDLVDIDVF
jgi:hypothetical protein